MPVSRLSRSLALSGDFLRGHLPRLVDAVPGYICLTKTYSHKRSPAQVKLRSLTAASLKVPQRFSEIPLNSLKVLQEFS